MLRFLRNKKAQNTVEYAIMIAVVIGVFSAMQLYMRRGLSARVKGGWDNIPGLVMRDTGNSLTVNSLFGDLQQYEPYYYAYGTSNMTTASSEGTERGTITEAGGIRDLTGASTSRTGSQTVTGIRNDVQ